MTMLADPLQGLDIEAIARTCQLAGELIDADAASLEERLAADGAVGTNEMQIGIMMALLDRVARTIKEPQQEARDWTQNLGWAVSYLCHSVGEGSPA